MKCFTYGQGILDQVSLFHALLSSGVVIQEDMKWIFFFLMWHQKIMEPLLIWDNY